MEDEIHEVVRFLAARMESHPEEFTHHDGVTGSLAISGRWEKWISKLGWHMNESEKALIYGKTRQVIFQRVHEEVLEELLNGPERKMTTVKMTTVKLGQGSTQQQAYGAQNITPSLLHNILPGVFLELDKDNG
jgi:hypothetical protein